MKKYQKIADELRARIKSEVYDPMRPLPDEMTLCETFDCSRMTIKKALDVLVHEGLVFRKRGHGTFIIQSSLSKSLHIINSQSVKGLTHAVGSKKVDSHIIEFKVELADALVSSRLNIKQESPVYNIIRLRVVENEPYVIEQTYMPTSIIANLDETILHGSIYQYIQDELHLNIKSAHKIIRADKPDDLDQKYLNCKDNDPILEVEQIAFLDNGVIFEYSSSRHRYDKFEFHSFSVQK